jgi:hypothetical protein
LSFVDPLGLQCYTAGGGPPEEIPDQTQGLCTILGGIWLHDPGTTITVTGDPPPDNLIPDSYNPNLDSKTGGSAGNVANNGQDCDNACQLAKAINQTGVQSLNNPCTFVGWYAASALEAGAGLAIVNARLIGTAAAENYPTLLHKFLTWLNGRQPRPGTLAAAIAVAKAAPGQIKDACSALQ